MGLALLAYDGSDHSKYAIQRSRELIQLDDAIVMYVSDSFVDWSLAPAVSPLLDVKNVDLAIRLKAEEIAEEGAEIATKAGYNARPEVSLSGRRAWLAIIQAAKSEGAEIIVAGTHGHTPILAGVLGSTAAGLAQRSTVPTLIIPTPK